MTASLYQSGSPSRAGETDFRRGAAVSRPNRCGGTSAAPCESATAEDRVAVPVPTRIVGRALFLEKEAQELAITLQGCPQVLGVLGAQRPSLLEAPTLFSEGRRQVLHDVGDQVVGLPDRLRWIV